MATQWNYKEVKREHSLFVDDPKIYQENHQNFEIVNEIIVKASMDTGACYGVKKVAEIVFRRGTTIKGGELAVLEEKMEAYKFHKCEQGNKINAKRVKGKERNKKEAGSPN